MTSSDSGQCGVALVRRARETDLQELAVLFRAEALCAQGMAGDFRVREDFDWVRYATAKLDNGSRELLVAESVNRVVGFVDLRIRSFPGAKSSGLPRTPRAALQWLLGFGRSPVRMPLADLQRGVIEGCFVIPEERANGIGRLLVESGMGWFLGMGIERVELGVYANNSALAFWERLGFRAYRITMCADLDAGKKEDAH